MALQCAVLKHSIWRYNVQYRHSVWRYDVQYAGYCTSYGLALQYSCTAHGTHNHYDIPLQHTTPTVAAAGDDEDRAPMRLFASRASVAWYTCLQHTAPTVAAARHDEDRGPVRLFVAKRSHRAEVQREARAQRQVRQMHGICTARRPQPAVPQRAKETALHVSVLAYTAF
eukprot:1879374-Rhodomonas_salina.1